MINLLQELQNFKQINLNSLAENGVVITDSIRNSIILYNKAIDSLQAGSEDIAIIELKKAIAINPSFNEALNLLGICYGYIHDDSKASEMFQRVMDAEKNSVLAMKYMDGLKGTGSAEATKGRKKVQKAAPAPARASIPPKEPAHAPAHLRSIPKFGNTGYVISAAAGAVIMLILCLIFMGGGGKDEAGSRVDAASPATTAVDTYKAKYDKLNQEYTKVKASLEEANHEVDYYRNAGKLSEVESLAAAKNYEAAADLLVMLKTLELKSPEKERFDSLYATVMPAAAKVLHEQGYKLYTQKKYGDAVAKLGKIQTYGTDYRKIDAVLYVLGKCYVELKDNQNALAAFEKVVTAYPNSSYAKYSRTWINSIKK